MLEHGRCLTPEEVEVLIARARRMRSEYLGALIVSAALRARQFYSRVKDQRIVTGMQRIYSDIH
jgi:hypothetical protein